MIVNRLSVSAIFVALFTCGLAGCATVSSETRGEVAGGGRVIAGMPMRWCPAGTFTMGSPRTESERRPGEDQVEVTLSRGFWIGQYEVTQGDWRRIVGELPGEVNETAGIGDDFAVYSMNYAEAEEFCRKATALARAAGELPESWEFRLPTEAQWEYACRAGTTTATAFGDAINSTQANIKNPPYGGAPEAPALNRACRVGSYPPNAWGIHDMHGNEVEWCRDWFHIRLPGGTDPDLYGELGTPSQNGAYSRSRRGSAWTDPAWASRSAFRQRFEPERRYEHIGMRLVVVNIG